MPLSKLHTGERTDPRHDSTFADARDGSYGDLT